MELTKRELFALAALREMIASNQDGPIADESGRPCKEMSAVQRVLSGYAVGYADALLKALNDSPPK